jgi:tRNA-uridine 2-sulfurtransferase
VADKPDSYEICFIPDDDYRGFLKRKVDGLEERVAGGEFVLSDGRVVGRHDGYPFYTIGQRRGLNLALGEPVYVTHIDPETNRITVGPREELFEDALVARQLNFVGVADLREEREVIAQIRYKDDGAPALALQTGPDELRVAFAEARAAITPGQSVVLYDGDDVLAGGWIHAVGERQRGDGAFVALPVVT